jgi:cell wall-associated NlpC family hydrolase
VLKDLPWWTQYLGIPWKPYATGPDAFDCWGLVWHCLQQQYGIQMPRHADVITDDHRSIHSQALLAIERGEWIPVDITAATDGCVVLLSQSKIFHHIGLFVDGGVLHARDGADVCWETLNDLERFGFRRVACYAYASR